MGLGGRRDEYVEHKRYLEQWNYPVWYYSDGYLTFVKTHRRYNIEFSC